MTGVVDEPQPAAASQCSAPLQGSRYAVCGRLSSSGFDAASVNGKHVVGSVDAAPGTTSSGYTIKGGSFHAYR